MTLNDKICSISRKKKNFHGFYRFKNKKLGSRKIVHESKPFEIDTIELSIEFNLSNIYLLAHSRPHSSFRFDGTYSMCNSGSIDFKFLLNFNCEVFLYFDRHELSIHSIIQHRYEKPQKASEIDRIDCVMPSIG